MSLESPLASGTSLEPYKSPWIVSPLWDICSLLSGFSVCILFLVLRPFSLHSFFSSIVVLYAFQFLSLFHSWSTTYLVTGSKLFKPLREKDPARFLHLPILIFIYSLLVGVLVAKLVDVPEDGSINSTSLLYYLGYMAPFMFGHFWHFGRQDFGVLSLYRNRSGQKSPSERRADETFMRLMMYVIQPLVYFYAFPNLPFTTAFAWMLPIRPYLNLVASVAVGAALLLFLAIFTYEIRKANRSIPKMLYYCVMLFHPAFLYLSVSMPEAALYWQASYMWSHWVIAIMLAKRVNVGFKMESGSSRRVAHFQHFLVIGGVTLLISTLLYPIAHFSILSGRDFLSVRTILRSLSPNQYLLVGAYFGFALGEQLVHYYCDRCLYSFRNGDVRDRVLPHLTG